MKVALDTNILAYAEGVNGVAMRDQALDIVRRLRLGAAVIPVQVLGELFSVLVHKAGRTPSDAREALLAWRDTFSTIETSWEIMQTATDLATDHKFGIWNAVILAAASNSGCRFLLSEDLQDGFTWGGVTVANPFDLRRRNLLEALLNQAPE